MSARRILLGRDRTPLGLLFLFSFVALGTWAVVNTAQAAFTATSQSTGNSLSAADCFDPMTEIDVGNFYFSPDPVTINVGCTVRWTVSQGSHTTTSDTGVWDSGMLSVGQSFSYTFTSTGTYSYHCTPHSNKPGQSNRQIIVQ